MSRDPASAAFVIMPFAPEFQADYDDVIEPAVRAAGLRCVRADQEALGQIHHMMLERIFESPVVVADITGSNPNVFYELGVSHSAGARTVTVAREDCAGRIPFDIAPYRVIVFPLRPATDAGTAEKAGYEARRDAAVGRLCAAISAVVDEAGEGVPNPVQAYLSTRSPLACVESRYVDVFSEADEEAMVRTARSEIVALGITGARFVTVLAGVIEAGERSAPLRVRILALDPDDRAGWRYVYHLREGRVVGDREFDDLLDEDRMLGRRVRQQLDRLSRARGFEAEIIHYTGIPVVWAYVVDDSRIIVGNYALNRLSSRLPTSVLVRDDRRTRSMYRYYASVLQGLADASAAARTEDAGQPR